MCLLIIYSRKSAHNLITNLNVQYLGPLETPDYPPIARYNALK